MPISYKERKELRAFIKSKNPVGTYIYDPVRSQQYLVKKTSVFEIYEFEYNEQSEPKDREDFQIDFLVRDAGKYSESYRIGSYPRKWCEL